MSREAYIPPSLSQINNTASANNSTTSTPTHSQDQTSEATKRQPSTERDPNAVDFSADDRAGRPKNYNSANLDYQTPARPIETKWVCVECEAVQKFGPRDYLRCRECGDRDPGMCFWKMKDYGKMDIDDRTWWAR